MLEGILGGTSSFLTEWAIPIAGFAGAWFMGGPVRDGLQNLLSGAIGGTLSGIAGNMSNRIVWAITTVIFVIVGIVIHKYLKNWIGKTVSFVFYGLAASSAYYGIVQNTVLGH